MPFFLAAGMSLENPFSIAGWAKPRFASTRNATGDSFVTVGTALPSTLPLRACSQ
jgi:hypothetical protein